MLLAETDEPPDPAPRCTSSTGTPPHEPTCPRPPGSPPPSRPGGRPSTSPSPMDVTNARTEGFNRIIKNTKRVACGFRNLENYQRRILSTIALTRARRDAA